MELYCIARLNSIKATKIMYMYMYYNKTAKATLRPYNIEGRIDVF